MKEPVKYPIKVQAVRSKGQKERPYVNIPIPLAAAIGLEAGEVVEWELLERGSLEFDNSPDFGAHVGFTQRF